MSVGGCVVVGYARKSVDSAGVYQLTDEDDFTVTSSEELRYDGDETVDDEGASLNSFELIFVMCRVVVNLFYGLA